MRVTRRLKVSEFFSINWIRDPARQGLSVDESSTDLRILAVRRLTACLRVSSERRKSRGGAQLDLDLPPARVLDLITGAVSQDILVAQLRADLCGYVQ
jgi:hypothetical protein